jgi:UDP-N-acetylmuramoyl-tripeptide--D-alanyl-D-alanine ligase
MMLTLSEAAALAGGTLCGNSAVIKRVVTDSRNIQPGDLFVALKGEHFDAHDFVEQVAHMGAAGAIVSKEYHAGIDSDAALIRVDDTRLALGRLAAGWRARFTLPLVGITGSNGKTTVKEMLGAILSAHAGTDAVLMTAGNFNNDIGLPLTLLGLNEAHRFAVIEMGMSSPGEIAYLTRLARPAAVLVNNALRAHLGGFESVEGIARAKAEIFEGLSEQGCAVINLDDDNAELFAELAAGHRMLRFGLKTGDVYAATHNLGADGSTLTIASPAGNIDVRLQVPGEHNVRNALAAASLALALEVPPSAIARGLMSFTGVKGRLQKKTAANGAAVIDDTYNANPDSMKAGLAVLARLRAPRWFVMGDIGELGETAPQLHAEVGEAARELGVDVMLTLGDNSRHAAQAFGPQARHFDEIEPLLAYLDSALPATASVLVKGSRFMRMERIVDHLVGKKGI